MSNMESLESTKLYAAQMQRANAIDILYSMWNTITVNVNIVVLCDSEDLICAKMKVNILLWYLFMLFSLS